MYREYFHRGLFSEDEFPAVGFLTETRGHFRSPVRIVPDGLLEVTCLTGFRAESHSDVRSSLLL